jgi:hypothetical protein
MMSYCEKPSSLACLDFLQRILFNSVNEVEFDFRFSTFDFRDAIPEKNRRAEMAVCVNPTSRHHQNKLQKSAKTALVPVLLIVPDSIWYHFNGNLMLFR